MPKQSRGLNDTFLKNLTLKNSKQTKFADSGGLFIQISPAGTKLWRMAKPGNHAGKRSVAGRAGMAAKAAGSRSKAND